MILKRTDGGGTDFNPKRLQILKELIDYFKISFITELHDHKGTLTVYWYGNPTKNNLDLIDGFWSAFVEYEVEHIIKEDIDKIYNELLFKLRTDYNDSVYVTSDNTIVIDSTAALFDYMDYEFNGKEIEEFESYKIINSFYSKFYVEWNDKFTQLVQINL